MRVFFLACFLFFLSITSYAQNELIDINDEYAVNFIKRQLKPPYIISGFIGKHLDKLGDKVSIALIKIIEDRDVKDREKINYFLDFYIRSGFFAPNKISREEDKSPIITLLFLNYLKNNVDDERLKIKISQSINYILKQTVNLPRLVPTLSKDFRVLD